MASKQRRIPAKAFARAAAIATNCGAADAETLSEAFNIAPHKAQYLATGHPTNIGYEKGRHFLRTMRANTMIEIRTGHPAHVAI